jgi:hypothetical protein
LSINPISDYGQNARKIERFISKNKVVDFDITYRADSVPENLNIQCEGVLVSSKNKQIAIPSELLSRFFSSKDVVIGNTGRLLLINHHSVQHGKAIISLNLSLGPSLVKLLKIPVNYRGNLILNYSGKNGEEGKDGETGKPGIMSGTTVTDPEKGGDGQNGTDGEPGGSFYIYLESSPIPGNHNQELINIFIHDKNDLPLDTFSIDKKYSGLYFILNGGNGGNAGNGGQGGHGADNEQSVSLAHGYAGAPGGKGGDGGNGGDGGQVMVYLNETLDSLLSRTQIINKGGKGGRGGKMGQTGARGTTSLYREQSPGRNAGDEQQKDQKILHSLDGRVGVNGPPIQTFFFKNRYSAPH